MKYESEQSHRGWVLPNGRQWSKVHVFLGEATTALCGAIEGSGHYVDEEDGAQPCKRCEKKLREVALNNP